MTNKMPKTGRIVLTPMLNPQGKLIGDFTIAKAADDSFYMWGSSQAQKYHMRWFEQHLPDGRFGDHPALRHGPRRPVDRRAEVARCAGSSSPTRMCRTPPSSSWTTASMDIAHCPALINRVTYTGDLGYEIWVTPEYQRRLYAGDHEGGRGAWHRQLRHAGAALACAWRRTSPPGTASFARSTAASRPAWTASST